MTFWQTCLEIRRPRRENKSFPFLGLGHFLQGFLETLPKVQANGIVTATTHLRQKAKKKRKRKKRKKTSIWLSLTEDPSQQAERIPNVEHPPRYMPCQFNNYQT